MLQSPLVDVETTVPNPPASPWVSIWFSPRRTIRRVLDSEAPPAWWPVIALAVVGQMIGALSFDPTGGVNVSASFMPVVLGAVQIVFGVLIGPFLLAFTGSWFGGEADPSEIRQAVAWGYVPIAIAGLGWIPVVLIYGGELAKPDPQIPLPVAIVGLAVVIGALWSVVTQVIALSEVQRFSIARAIASMLILLIPLLLLRLF